VTAATTIVIPARGAGAQLIPLLRALEEQSGPGRSLPVIVSDDASPEPLEQQLAGLAPTGLELRFVRGATNGGPGAARNRGLALVATPWVTFVDADEVPAAGWLARLDELLADPDAADVIAGRVAIPSAASPFEHATEAAADAEQYVAGNVTFRAEQLRADGAFDERYYDARRSLHFREDADLRFRLEAAGRQIQYDAGLVVDHPPLPASFWTPVRLARRYYFDPLLAREHPERFRAFVRSRRAGPFGLRRARHDAALIYAGGLCLTATALAGRRPSAARAGAAAAVAGWGLNVAALAWRRRLRPGDVPALAALGGAVPLVYLWHFYRGVRDFRHHPRF
jgi:glycosyltransferase involved in cell wall biosynthesis